MSLILALDHLFSRSLNSVVGGCSFSLSVTAVLLSMAEPASAVPKDPTITVSLDENGNATISPSSVHLAVPLIGQDTDPISGIQTLRYEFSSSSGSLPLTPGDVEVCENPACTSISDVLRFINNTVNNQLFVFSDAEPGEASQADVGIPPSLQGNVVQVVESGTEGASQGITYTPTSGEPGFFVAGPDEITYDFTSDVGAPPSPVPEPSSWSIVATSLVCLLGWSLRTKRTRGISVK
jgi:hypothetical protein